MKNEFNFIYVTQDDPFYVRCFFDGFLKVSKSYGNSGGGDSEALGQEIDMDFGETDVRFLWVDRFLQDGPSIP